VTYIKNNKICKWYYNDWITIQINTNFNFLVFMYHIWSYFHFRIRMSRYQDNMYMQKKIAKIVNGNFWFFLNGCIYSSTPMCTKSVLLRHSGIQCYHVRRPSSVINLRFSIWHFLWISRSMFFQHNIEPFFRLEVNYMH
jgi:hypothetical protein